MTADRFARPELETTLPPTGRLLWRAADQVQLEAGGRRVLVSGVDTAVVRRLVGRPGTDRPGTPPAGTAALQRTLVERGLLWPARPAGDTRRRPPRPRLASELAALSACHGERAAEVLAARGHCTVVVHGAGRVGPHVAALLAAAGVGRVHLAEREPARLHHAMPGGVAPADEGEPLDSVTAAAVRHAAPGTDCSPPPASEPPDLAVLALDRPPDEERRDALHRLGTAHLLVSLDAERGVVGPLVIPGLTGCLHCADLHRLDRDPAWTALAVQLALPHPAGTAGAVALATVIAGVAALQALDFLDGGQPASVEGSLELHPPDWRLRRRSWPAHPGCGCLADS